MDRTIRYKLEQLAKRLRSQVFACLLIGLWMIMLATIFQISKQTNIGNSPSLSNVYLLSIFLVGSGLLYLWSRFGYRDLRSIAERIEKRFPDIDQKLVTAIEAPKPSESEFLRQKLIEETLSHSKKHPWEEIVPRRRLSMLWGLQWMFLLCALILPLILRTTGDQKPLAANPVLEKLTDWVIEPGNTQIEKGTDLLVSVRFPEQFTEEMKLIAESPDGETQSISLQRSMRDPIASASLRRVNQPLRYRIEGSSKTSEPFTVQIYEHPSVVQSDALIRSPAYAQQDEKTIANTRRVSIVDGATVAWSLRLNKPVVSAEWIDEDGETSLLEANPEDPTEYRIANHPESSKRYRLRMTDAQGRTEKTAEEFIVKVIPNREPELKLTSASDQRVSAIQEMMVAAKVQDDFGIHRAGINVSVGESEPQDIVLTSPSELANKKTDLQHLIDLESLSAKADQLVTYHFWTEDLDRNGQPRRIESDLFFAEVRPFEELFREGDSSATQQRQQQQQQQQQGSQGEQQAEELAELQKKIISATWNLIRGLSNLSGDQNQALTDKVSVVRESQNQAIEQSEKLKENLQSPESEQDLFRVQSSMRDAIKDLDGVESQSASIGLRDAMKHMRAAYEGLLRLRAREHEITQSQQQQSSSQQSQSASQRNRQQQIQQLKLEQDPSRYEEESQPIPEESQAEREMRQVINRLDELARRQQDVNEQVRELDLALQAATDEQEKKELQEQLDRLREDQQELVQDADELLERMNNPETRNALEESRKQIENAREQMQKSEQQLRNAEPSAALNSGTRAQQNVDDTRQKLREQSSEALKEDVQRLVQQAQKVTDKQTELERQLRDQTGQPPRDTKDDPNAQEDGRQRRESLLRSEAELSQDPNAQANNLEAWKDQKQQYLDLLDRIKETVEQAEGSEPLLAEQLYETFRDASRQPTEQRLDRIPMMLERGMDQPSVEESQEVSKDLQGIRDRIEKSTESILGSEEDSLRRALKEIDRANRAIQDELAQRGAADPESSQPTDSQPSEGQPSEGQPREGQPREGQPREGQPSEGQPSEGQPSEGQPSEGQPGEGQPSEGQPSEGQPSEGQPSEGQPSEGQPSEGQPSEGQPSEGQPSRGQTRGQQPNNSSSERSARSVLEQLEARAQRSGGPELSAPLMGEDYAQWTDRLRDIEELVRDPDLKAEAARVREAARDFRMEYKRHSREPQWDLVKKMISNPLQELQRRVQEELVRKTAKQNELVPLDRDPVPERFRSELDRYFERLGGEQSK